MDRSDGAVGQDESEGLNRTDAVAELEGIQVTTWLAPVTNGEVGPLVAQSLVISATNDVVSDRFPSGSAAVRSWGFITQLRAGEYRSVTQVRHADPTNHDWTFDWTVAFTVTK